jgi:hypothetical protein
MREGFCAERDRGSHDSSSLKDEQTYSNPDTNCPERGFNQLQVARPVASGHRSRR